MRKQSITISKTSNAYKDKQNNNEFEEEMRRLKITCAETINIDQTKINNLLQQNKKKNTHTHTVSTTT